MFVIPFRENSALDLIINGRSGGFLIWKQVVKRIRNFLVHSIYDGLGCVLVLGLRNCCRNRCLQGLPLRAVLEQCMTAQSALPVCTGCLGRVYLKGHIK